MTEFYTRNQYGQIEEHDSIEQAVKEFLSYDGYRLDIAIEDTILFISRDELPNIEKSFVAESSTNYRLKYDARIDIHKVVNK